jgi:hypothetical protein
LFQKTDNKKAALGCPSAASPSAVKATSLDQVDVGWEIGGNFHANGLLANLWLVPDFHDDLLNGLMCSGGRLSR